MPRSRKRLVPVSPAHRPDSSRTLPIKHPAAIAALVGIGLLLALFTITAWTAWLGKCATFDEPLHFMGAWIQTHYDDFRCNPEDPPLWKYYIALGTRKDDLKIDRQSPLWDRMLHDLPAPAVHFFSQTLYETPGVDADVLLRAARARMLLFGILLGAAIAWWAWRLRGPVAALVAAAFFCLDPNFLAHSPLIKNDVPITLIFLLLMAAVWLLGERLTWLRWLAVSLLLGVALTVKYSGVLGIPMLAIALICRVFIARPWPVLNWTAKTRWRRFAAAATALTASCLVGYLMIWASYGFRFRVTPDPNQHFDLYQLTVRTAVRTVIAQNPNERLSNARIQQLVDGWRPSYTVRFIQWAYHHHALPEAWLCGFLYTYGESLARRAFLCGQISWLGWWYYFPFAMAFKTPLATLAALGLAAVLWLAWCSCRSISNPWPVCAVLIAPILYMAMAMRTHLNIGLRHVLPVYPYLFIFLGVIAADAVRRRPRISIPVVLILLLGVAAETYSAYPDFIPFFNVAAGGARGGLDLLSDSNIDWGQDLPALAQWQRENPGRQMYLCHFGAPDPRYYGLHYIDMDGSFVDDPDEKTPAPLPPVFAISAVALQGIYMNPSQLKIYERFRHQQPIAVLHGSIYLFDSPQVPLVP